MLDDLQRRFNIVIQFILNEKRFDFQHFLDCKKICNIKSKIECFGGSYDDFNFLNQFYESLFDKNDLQDVFALKDDLLKQIEEINLELCRREF